MLHYQSWVITRAQLSKDRIYVKSPSSFYRSDLQPDARRAKGAEVVKQAIPALGVACDLKEALLLHLRRTRQAECLWNAFEFEEQPAALWHGSQKTGKTVHNHYDDIFAYWMCRSLTIGYTEGLNGLIKMSNRLWSGL
ncbi:transposase [Klebsiella pneumoniae]|uniref:transposase n=1 Tax=Klebsiella pneumoniae TaxID=573 RepID=UPI00351E94BF